MINTREAVSAALFNLLKQTTGIVNAIRGLNATVDLGTVNMPALELVVKEEMGEYKGTGLPIYWQIKFCAFLYASTIDPSNLAETQLNTFLDAIEAALKPSPATGKNTLGGLVFDCRINGPILRDPGFQSGIGAAAVPIEVTTTS